MEYRLLFTGIGRRVELIQAFRQAALNLNINLKLYGVDVSATAPALAFCDYTRKICGMLDEDYIQQLLRICVKDKIDLLIPTIDTDLLVLAQNIKKFEMVGTKVLVSQPDKIIICRDKNQTADFFETCGLKTPKTVSDWKCYKDTFPCFIKPKDGSSSINAFKIENPEDLQVYVKRLGDYIIQPFIDGTEYTVDIFCDYSGKPVYITPRIRLTVRSGEVLKTKISMDEQIIEESKTLIDNFKPVGPITVQLIRQNCTGDDYFIEINPRFGGGVPLSMKAGAKSAEALLQMLMGHDIKYQENVIDGAIFSRFDQSVCIIEGKLGQSIAGIIFDLDDTLYSEKQYIRSGYRSIAKLLGNEKYANDLWQYFLAGKPAIDELLTDLNCIEKKAECLEAYREQIPEISLYDGVTDMLQKLKDSNIKLGIITDGRVSGQKKKIKALGLDKLVNDIIITDELGGIQFRKPNDISFRIMQCRWRIPFEQMAYVGDNCDKDFLAPRRLGMQALFFKNEDGVYKTNTDNLKSIKAINDVINFV